MMLEEASKRILTSSMGVQEDETVLIVTDTALHDIGATLFETARPLCREAMLMVMGPRSSHGEEPPDAIAAAMLQADVVLMPTLMSLSHTKARGDACARGARIGSMPHVTRDMLARMSKADFARIDQYANLWADLLSKASDVRITSDNGTDLSFSIAGRPGNADGGVFRHKGAFGNIPSGEAFVAPVEGTANGTLVIDGSIDVVGIVESPIVITVKDGLAVAFDGGDDAKKLEGALMKFGPDARNIAELGIGINSAATLSGNTLEDEKIKGTVHIALGDNSTFGGTVSSPSHLDGLIMKPTMYLDGELVIEDTKWKV
jgi:leucyl aminopeptidase (aminopeptidase T)